ncbi:MAG: 2-amino-4-hydroxy-6-hydroxymethyldihydropteridine diphosphokinase [Pirellulales bacterium]|nr:2-amino-4-hydroxy-6-hydroxymethyldihydropteridine diphosphokinase [Pirellulales bacterium]
MSLALLALGSNLGDRRAILDAAIGLLARHDAVRVARVSRWHETFPVGGPAGQPLFLNGAALLETLLAPHGLLSLLIQVETDLGRLRVERWGKRTLDLDLLLYDDVVLETPELVVPHPRMAWRRFVLEPAAEIAPSMSHPKIGWTIRRLLDHLNSAADYVAITGTAATGKTLLAERLAKAESARLLAEDVDPERLAAFYRDPAGAGWEMELEFFWQRADLLSAGRPGWQDRLTVSDFWFDQSNAYASVWLAPDQFAEFREKWQAARRDVVKPKLIVLLHAPPEEFRAQIERRGRTGERDLPARVLEEVERAIRDEAARPDQGPVFLLPSGDIDQLLAETRAAVESMR